MNPLPWRPDRSVATNARLRLAMPVVTSRGSPGQFSGCGPSRPFHGFPHVVAARSHRGAPPGLARVDDAAPSISVLITGQAVVQLLFVINRMSQPSVLVMSAILLPLAFFVVFGLLRPLKGGTVRLMPDLDLLQSGAGEI